MFNIFGNKKLENRIASLEDMLKDALEMNCSVIRNATEQMLSQKLSKDNIENEIGLLRESMNSLIKENQRLEKKNNELSLVVSGSLSITSNNKIDVKETRIDNIKKIAEKLVIPELKPSNVDLKKVSIRDKVSILSDLLMVEVGNKRNTCFIKGLENSPTLRVVHFSKSTGVYTLTNIASDCYAIVVDEDDDKFYLTYLTKETKSNTESQSFAKNSIKMTIIRTNHHRVLRVLQDKVKNAK